MTPKEYKARYNKLKVKRPNGTIETVSIHKYVLNNTPGYFNKAAMEAFRTQFFARRIDTDLTIFTGDKEVQVKLDLTKSENKWEKKGVPMRFEMNGANGETQISAHDIDWGGFCVYCFLGKGAPEHYQVVLQLADHWGLAPNGLQAYADSALGLDCNGFVGNYIWHGRKGNAWSKAGFRDLKGPDSAINNFFEAPNFVSRWEDINPNNTYVFGMVNKANQIIPGGKGPAGHIMISQPGVSGHGHWDTYSPSLYVVESTAGAISPGLTEGWYECLSYDQKTKVFHLHRGAKMMEAHSEIRCKIVQLV